MTYYQWECWFNQAQYSASANAPIPFEKVTLGQDKGIQALLAAAFESKQGGEGKYERLRDAALQLLATLGQETYCNICRSRITQGGRHRSTCPVERLSRAFDAPVPQSEKENRE